MFTSYLCLFMGPFSAAFFPTDNAWPGPSVGGIEGGILFCLGGRGNDIRAVYFLNLFKKNLIYCGRQRCGSGAGIRCLFDPWIWDPG